MSLLYLLVLCFAVTNARTLKDDLSDVVSDISNLSTKGLSLHGSLDLSPNPKLTVSTPEVGLSASVTSGQDWLNAVRNHIKNKVSNLNAALNEIETAHSNLNTVAVPVAVSNINPVVVPVENEKVSPVTVPLEQESPPVAVVKQHDVAPLQVTVKHESTPVAVVEHQNLVPVQVETVPKVDKLDVSKSAVQEEVLRDLCNLKPELCEGGRNLGLATGLKLHLPHLNIGGDISFNGDDYLNDIAKLSTNLKANLKKLNPLTGLEGLVSDSENKLNRLKALVNLHNLKLGGNEGLVNVLCQLNPDLCADNNLGILLKPQKPSFNVDINSALASLLESLKGKGLSRDGDAKEVVPIAINVAANRPFAINQPVPVAQPVAVSQPVPAPPPVVVNQPAPVPQPVAVNQPVPVPQPVVVSQPVPVGQPVAVAQDVPVNQYSVGIPVSVRVPELQSIPVSQPTAVSQAVPVSQYSVGVPVSQYNVGVPVSVRVPEIQSVSQDVPVDVGVPVNLDGSLQGSLGSGLSGGFEASLNGGEGNSGVLVSGVPLYAYHGTLPHEEVRVDGDYSRRSGGGRKPNVYGGGRGFYRAPIPMAGINYGRRV